VLVSDRFEDRLSAVEERLAMEAGLRASIDRDLATIAQRQSAANHLIQALAITQAEHTTMLEALQSDLGTVRQDVGTLKIDVGDMKSDVSVLKTDVGDMKSDVGVLKSDVGVLKSDVGVLKGQMSSVHDKLDRILTTLERD